MDTAKRCCPFALPAFTGFGATTSNSAPVLRIDTCTLTEAFRLGSSLSIGATGSHVPHHSLVQAHAVFMPNAAQPISRLPLGSIPSQPFSSVLALLAEGSPRILNVEGRNLAK